MFKLIFYIKHKNLNQKYLNHIFILHIFIYPNKYFEIKIKRSL